MIAKHRLAGALLLMMPMLSGCGAGGGGEVRSAASVAVADPNAHSVSYSFSVLKPLDPAPAWTSGAYQGIALIESASNGPYEQAPAGTVGLTVDMAAKTYALTIGAGSVTVAPASFSIPPLGDPTPCPICWTDSYIGSTVRSVTHWSDGVARPQTDGTGDATAGSYHNRVKTQNGQKELTSDLRVSSMPGRHVSLGSWALSEVPLNPDGTHGDPGAISTGVFAFGDRTPPGDIPASGTARYTVEMPPEDALDRTVAIRSTAFDVDFGSRTIAADLVGSVDVSLYSDGSRCCFGWEETIPNPASRIGTVVATTQVSGSAPFSSTGSFDIALAGTQRMHIERNDNGPGGDDVQTVAGTISGAFFGPKASEIGGTFILPSLFPLGPAGPQIGAFSAVQAKP